MRSITNRLLKRNAARACSLFVVLFCLMLVGCASITSKNPGERLKALNSISDQVVLAKVAFEDTERYVRLAAVKKLTNQSMLAKVANEDKELSVRLAAVEKLTDQGVLAKVGQREHSCIITQDNFRSYK